MKGVVLRILGFLIIFLSLILALKIYSSNLDMINMNLRPYKVCDNCTVTVDSSGTKIQKENDKGYSFSNIVSFTSKGIGLNSSISDIINKYDLKENYAKLRIENNSNNIKEYIETYYKDKKSINNKSNFIIYFTYIKNNTKWELLNLNTNNNSYNETLTYYFTFNNNSLTSFEVKHVKNS